MSKMWAPFIAMGFMVLLAAFAYGLFTSAVTSYYFDNAKEVREAAIEDSDIAKDKAFIESTKAWLPSFKSLGMRMILGGVSFLLATTLGALRTGGGRVQEALGVPVRIIKPPITATILFPDANDGGDDDPHGFPDHRHRPGFHNLTTTGTTP